MEPLLLTKRAKYQTPAKATVPGVLSVYGSSIKWQASHPSTEPGVTVQLSNITSECRMHAGHNRPHLGQGRVVTVDTVCAVHAGCVAVPRIIAAAPNPYCLLAFSLSDR